MTMRQLRGILKRKRVSDDPTFAVKNPNSPTDLLVQAADLTVAHNCTGAFIVLFRVDGVFRSFQYGLETHEFADVATIATTHRKMHKLS